MILVTGASGNVGRRVVQALAQSGREQRVLVRGPEQAAEFEAMGVAALVGDVGVATDREAALVAVDAVVACHSAHHTRSGDVEAIDGDATVALIEAAADAGVKHFVLLSHLAAGQAPACRWLAAKQRAEEVLQRQDRMTYTILRLAPLMSELTRFPGFDNPGRTGTLLVFGDGQTRITPLSPADAAWLAARCSEGDRGLNETVEVGGPETYTWNELAGLFSRAYRRPVAWWRLPLFLLAAVRWLLGWVDRRAADRAGYYEVLYGQDMEADPGRVAELFGIETEDLLSYLRREEGAVAAEPEMKSAPADEPPVRTVEPQPPEREVTEEQPPDRTTEAAAEPAEENLEEPPLRVLEPPVAEPEGEPDEEPAEESSDENSEPEPDEGGWGTHVEFGDQTPAESDEGGRRPPVSRPESAEGPVIDADPDGG